MRKAKPKKRVVLPDPVYGDVKVSKFVNHLMYDGKKSISYRIFYDALEIVGNKMKEEEKTPLEIWKDALQKVTPQVEVRVAASAVPPSRFLLRSAPRVRRVSR